MSASQLVVPRVLGRTELHLISPTIVGGSVDRKLLSQRSPMTAPPARNVMDNMPLGRNTIVFGAFTSADRVGHAINQLIAARLSNSEVSLLMTRQMRPGFLLDAALSVSGVESFVGAGPVMVALARLIAQRANGVIVAALVSVGFPHTEAIRFDDYLREGAVLLGVHCDALDETARAQHILKISGANDITSAGRGIVTSRLITRG